jgi:hypothetical protein
MLFRNWEWAVFINSEWLQFVDPSERTYDLRFLAVVSNHYNVDKSCMAFITSIEEKYALFWAALYSYAGHAFKGGKNRKVRASLQHHCDYALYGKADSVATIPWVSHPLYGDGVKFRKSDFDKHKLRKRLRLETSHTRDGIVSKYGLRGTLVSKHDTCVVSGKV